MVVPSCQVRAYDGNTKHKNVNYVTNLKSIPVGRTPANLPNDETLLRLVIEYYLSPVGLQTQAPEL